MELKSLVLGVVMSTAAFALKAGGGLAYLFLKRPGAGQRFWAAVLFSLGYAVLFAVAALVLSLVDPKAHLDTLQTFFESGMTLHFILAALLMVWGIGLIRRHPDETGMSKSWIALVVPCPVCFSVVLLSSGFITALYPDRIWAIPALCTGFIALSFGVALAGYGLLKRSAGAKAMDADSVGLSPSSMPGYSNAPEALLGKLMLFISVYFILSVVVVPQFADLDKIYRISSAGTAPFHPPGRWWLMALGGLALLIGFFNPFKKKM